MKNAKQKQRGIVGSGGKLINHGDTEITKRGKRKLENGKRIHAETRGARRGAEGAVDRIETFGKGRDRPTTGWPEGQDERERTSQPERSGVTNQFTRLTKSQARES